jgi:xanthine dehydrogenase accessory factor
VVEILPGAERHDGVIVTVLATEGSAPRGAGAAMRVTADASRGTIGGGALEHLAIAQARLLLDHPPGAWRVQDYPLGPLLGQCCGGRVRLLIERDGAVLAGDVLRFTPDAVLREPGRAPTAAARGARPAAGDRIAAPCDRPRTPLALFGAGHVGRAVARAVEGLPFLLRWYDVRVDLSTMPGVTLLADDEVERRAASGGAVLVMTHDHALDYRIVRAALSRPTGFVGLIGSATKRARFVARLRAEGVDPARLTCPIGIAGIAGKEPAVIAAAVAAQLLLECMP